MRLLLLVAAAACATPKLVRTGGEWRVEGAAYQVDAATDGNPMPAGWFLKNYDPDGDGFHKKDRKDTFDFLFGREKDDGSLVVRRGSLTQEDSKKDLRVLFDRELNAIRMVNVVLTRNNPGARGLEIRTITVPGSVAVDGAEALDGQYEVAANGVAEPFRRCWTVLARSLARDQIILITYANTPNRYPDGLDDAKSFVGRIRFDATPR